MLFRPRAAARTLSTASIPLAAGGAATSLDMATLCLTIVGGIALVLFGTCARPAHALDGLNEATVRIVAPQAGRRSVPHGAEGAAGAEMGRSPDALERMPGRDVIAG